MSPGTWTIISQGPSNHAHAAHELQVQPALLSPRQSFLAAAYMAAEQRSATVQGLLTHLANHGNPADALPLKADVRLQQWVKNKKKRFAPEPHMHTIAAPIVDMALQQWRERSPQTCSDLFLSIPRACRQVGIALPSSSAAGAWSRFFSATRAGGLLLPSTRKWHAQLRGTALPLLGSK